MNSEIIENLRQDYRANSLDERDALPNPFDMFEKWFEEALKAGLHEPNAMTLATANLEARPSARIVLLKGFDSTGFVFYTNYHSKKGLEMSQNPQASLLFYWGELERQIRINGTIARVSDPESSAYFHSRPRASQLGAWASPQSQIITDRSLLDENWKKLDEEYAHRELPKPDHWGGFRLHPQDFEFWQGRPSRLHDRLAYHLEGKTWVIDRLAP